MDRTRLDGLARFWPKDVLLRNFGQGWKSAGLQRSSDTKKGKKEETFRFA
jgi:hypothetical protein